MKKKKKNWVMVVVGVSNHFPVYEVVVVMVEGPAIVMKMERPFAFSHSFVCFALQL